MNKEKFTEMLLWNMYELGNRKAEVEDGVIFFFETERELLNPFLSRIAVECTTIDKKDHCFDIGELLGIVDWYKIPVDTPILIRDEMDGKWEKGYFAKYDNNRVYAWTAGRTSFTVKNKNDIIPWEYGRVARIKNNY